MKNENRCILLCLSLFAGAVFCQAEEYRYRFKGAEVALQPSVRRIVQQEQAAAVETEAAWQPVFELGLSTFVPTDEVIVGFEVATTTEQAEQFLQQFGADQGLVAISHHRKDRFIVTIDKPSGGRAFPVSVALSELDGIEFAEPNFMILPEERNAASSVPLLRPDPAPAPAYALVEAASSLPVWTTLASLDFESGLGGWTSESRGTSPATWFGTSHRSHGGSYSLYCAQSHYPAPGPADNNMSAWLVSPTYNLVPYEEVYIEAWFYTVNQVGGDFPMLSVFDNASSSADARELFVDHTDDMTLDETTQDGWRKVLYRVPPNLLTEQTYFCFSWQSDGNAPREGCYLDDIRLVATTDVDLAPPGNDPYAARQWSHRNTGQIAGLGNDANDLHTPEAWLLVPEVSSSIVLAIVDSGVDLTHPDLNIVAGYEDDGSPGGGPRHEHGTACAGEAGAIRNNGIGVIGTAPGVGIMAVACNDSTASLAKGIDVAVANGAKILSNSWGWNDAYSTDIEDAIDDAIAAGCILLFAAGNGPLTSPNNYHVAFPASLATNRAIICVGGSSPTDEPVGAASSDGQFDWGSSYANNGGPDVCAPTTWSYTTDIQGSGGYNSGSSGIDADYTHDFSGTSSATPKVAGIVALMLTASPSLTPAEVKAILRTTADDIGEPGFDNKTGAGRVNAWRAVSAVLNDQSVQANLVVNNGMVEIGFQGKAYQSFKLSAAPSLGAQQWIDRARLTLDGAGNAWFSEQLPTNDALFYKTAEP